MKASTELIRFDLDERLKEYATIERSDSGIWGVETTRGISTWGMKHFNSFDSAYAYLKSYEKEAIKDYLIDNNLGKYKR